MNSYLKLAARVLEEAREPLSSRQILHAAYRLQIVPADLYGKTQHKTLQARLSEDILRSRNKSHFVRTAPGRFFLRRFLATPTPNSPRYREHHAPLRADQLKRFHVLCIPTAEVSALQETSGPFFTRQELESLPAHFERLSSVAGSSAVYLVQVFVVLRKGEQILIQSAAGLFEDDLGGPASIGLFGFVKPEDHTMFSVDQLGLREAALRTIIEQLPVPSEATSELQPVNVPEHLECLIQSDLGSQEKTIMALQLYAVPPQGALDAAVEASEAFGWKPASDRVNNLEPYDSWSRLLIQQHVIGQLITADTAIL